jgi:hypothetical protein
MVVEHAITITDIRLRFDAREVYVAHCSCGWVGEERRGRSGKKKAALDGRQHVDSTCRAADPPPA